MPYAKKRRVESGGTSSHDEDKSKCKLADGKSNEEQQKEEDALKSNEKETAKLSSTAGVTVASAAPRKEPKKRTPKKKSTTTRKVNKTEKKATKKPPPPCCVQCQIYKDRIIVLELELKRANDALEELKAKQTPRKKCGETVANQSKKRSRTAATTDTENKTSSSKQSTKTTTNTDVVGQKKYYEPVIIKPHFFEDPAKKWEERFSQLMHFQKGYGHCRVPKSFKPPELARWVAYLRTLYAQNTAKGEWNNMLTRERVERLNAVGFEWRCQKVEHKSWEERFEDLVKFKAKFGHTRVPRLYKEDTSLGEWCHGQRNIYKQKRKCIQGERTDKLNSIGFEWRVADAGMSWDERYEQLVEFRRHHGHVNVPSQREIDERKANGEKKGEQDSDDVEGNSGTYTLTIDQERSLSRWVREQRNQYFRMKTGQKTRMNWTKEKKLEQLGFDWYQEPQLNTQRVKEANNVPWETRVEQLKEYKAKHDNMSIPFKYRGDQNLGVWAANIRVISRKWLKGEKFNGDFTQEQFDQLRDLGFDFYMDVETQKRVGWNERFRQLVDYKKKFGNTRVPQLWAGNPQLANWVNEQRRQYRMKNEGKQQWLTSERITLLEEIGFEWSVTQAIHKKRLEKQQAKALRPQTYRKVDTSKETETQAEDSQDVSPTQTDPAVPRLPPHEEYTEQQRRPPSPPPLPPPPLQEGYEEQKQQSQPHPGYTPAEQSPLERYMEHLTQHQEYPGNFAPQQGRPPDQNENQHFQPHHHEPNYGGQSYGGNFY